VGIEITRVDAIATVTLRSADGLNVADPATLEELRDGLASLAGDRAVRAVVLTGAGDRAFCAGADIRYMSTLDREGAAAWSRLGHEAARLLEQMPKVSIAAINGLALGGGCELALACDLRYASSAARLGQPEVNVGIMPGWGGTQRLARATSPGFAKELILTGRLVDAAEAFERGLVSGVADPVLDRALEAARLVAAKGPNSIAEAKRLCNAALQGELSEGLDEEVQAFSSLFDGAEAHEGLRAFLEKREPDYSGDGR
jgi:enoyl-CoA hydratase